MEIKDNDYSVVYDEGSKTVKFSGNIRLQGVSEYEPIKKLLADVGDKLVAGDTLKMDYKDLKFLNSAGITTLSMFVINMRKKNTAQISVIGSKTVAWQEKSLTNFSKIWSDIQVAFED
ncbi:MAG: hypothetical protein KDK41_10075 [Leptospiraceae bacterium]|nr:hypothetical protein [Leptospiraceae bacterium]MCB1200981.1 hypothetical protein [Leptospiraceae bacterium]